MPNVENEKPPSQHERWEKKFEWAQREGLTEYSGSAYLGLNFLTRQKRNDWQDNNFPAADHVTYWKKNGKPYCIVSQPYHLDNGEMAKISALCITHNLDVIVTTFPSWHYPGSVLFMEWRKKSNR